SGLHSLNITFLSWPDGVNDSVATAGTLSLPGSPFAVTVAPGPTAAAQCAAAAVATAIAVAGIPVVVTVQAHDAFGNRRGSGGDLFEAPMLRIGGSAPEDAVRGTAADLGTFNGTFAVELTPTVAGVYHLSVTLAGAEAGDGPWIVTVTSAAAHGPASIAWGAGLAAVTATLQSTFWVRPRDAFGNDVSSLNGSSDSGSNAT
ncbi:unnamed protein product, partial [Phaeothamnion confervicola]